MWVLISISMSISMWSTMVPTSLERWNWKSRVRWRHGCVGAWTTSGTGRCPETICSDRTLVQLSLPTWGRTARSMKLRGRHCWIISTVVHQIWRYSWGMRAWPWIQMGYLKRICSIWILRSQSTSWELQELMMHPCAFESMSCSISRERNGFC